MDGIQLGQVESHGLDDSPSADHRADSHYACAQEESQGKHPNELLTVVAPVTEGHERRRGNLEATKNSTDPSGCHPMQRPVKRDHQPEAAEETEECGEEETEEDQPPSVPQKDLETAVGQAGPREGRNQGMAFAGGQPIAPCQCAPRDDAEHGGRHRLDRDGLGLNDPFPTVSATAVPEKAPRTLKRAAIRTA